MARKEFPASLAASLWLRYNQEKLAMAWGVSAAPDGDIALLPLVYKKEHLHGVLLLAAAPARYTCNHSKAVTCPCRSML